jgi:glucosamine--fructose-6-phosphate aminotransferase (isomerizing)
MCGICCYIGDTNAFNCIFDGLTILQNRGYDSCGIATINNNNITTTKYASTDTESALSKLSLFSKNHNNDFIGIGHTRWATHGVKCDRNSHPHSDAKNRIVLVHNGIIENYATLYNNLIKKGYTFTSETDTEVIANLISSFLDDGYDIYNAIENSTKIMIGTWGLAILYIDEPNKLFLTKNSIPLLVGLSTNRCSAYIASEQSAFSNHINQYFSLDDKKLLVLTKNEDNNIYQYVYSTKESIDFNTDTKLINTISEYIPSSPEPFPHYTIKEIYEQSESVIRAINNGGRLKGDYEVHIGGLDSHSMLLNKIRHLIILACGTSYNAGLVGSKYMRELRAFDSVRVIDAAEFSIYDIPPIHHDYGVLAISQSGETRDVITALNIVKTYNIPIISVVNVVGSLITRLSTCGIYLKCGREVGVAATKSFTSQCIVLVLLGIWFSQNRETASHLRGQLITGLRNMSFNISETFKLYEQCKNIALKLQDHSTCFILGSGHAEPITYEAALKLKEIGYINAQGYPSGALKHGPFAIIENNTPIFFIILDDESNIKTHLAASATKTRGSYNILITNRQIDDNSAHYDDIITVPHNTLGNIVSIIPFQFIAYCLGIFKNTNPDTPKHLAKTVTVS